MPDDIDTLRRTLAASLPARIQSALDGYERFTALEPPEDAKGFAAWHAAAKAALAHVEVLVKLARWAEGNSEDAAEDGGGIDRMLADARAALDALDEGEDEP